MSTILNINIPADTTADQNALFFGAAKAVSLSDDHTSSIIHEHTHPGEGMNHSHAHRHATGKPSHDTQMHFQQHGYAEDYADVAEDAQDGGADEATEDKAKATLSSAKRDNLDSDKFAYIDKDGGKHLPINDADHVRNALARLNQTHFESDAKKATARRKIEAAAKRFGIETSAKKEVLIDTLNTAGSMSLIQKAIASLGLGKKGSDVGIVITKDANDDMRWFTRYSNAWQDRDGEVLTTESHKDYTNWADKTGNYPELWVWHTPGTRLGVADWLDFSDGFAFASGTIDKEAQSVVEKLVQGEKALGVSHGFVSLQRGKYVVKHRSFEISLLPLDRASVWTTDFNINTASKEQLMAFTDEKRRFMVNALGEERVKQLESAAESAATSLKQAGIEFKETEAAGETNTLQVLASSVASLTETVGKLATNFETVTKEVASLKQTDDEKLAAMLTSRMAGSTVVRPTEKAANEVSSADAAQLSAKAGGEVDWFSGVMEKQWGGLVTGLGGVGTPAPATVTVTDGAGN